MDRASSYSTGGGSGANSENEALNASLQNSTRLEIITQVRLALSCVLHTGVEDKGYTPSGRWVLRPNPRRCISSTLNRMVVVSMKPCVNIGVSFVSTLT